MRNKEISPAGHTGQYKDAGTAGRKKPKNEIEGEPNFHRGNTLHPAPHLGGPYEKDRLDEDRSYVHDGKHPKEKM